MPSIEPNWASRSRRGLGPDAQGPRERCRSCLRSGRGSRAPGSGGTPSFSRTSRGPYTRSRIESHRTTRSSCVVDELHEVLVGADDDDAPALVHRAHCHRGDEIVGLETVPREARDVPRAHDLLDPRHLLGEVRRRGRARGLVPRVDRVPERRPSRVHRHGEEVRPPLARPPSAACSPSRVRRASARRASSRAGEARGRRGRRTPRDRPGRGRRARRDRANAMAARSRQTRRARLRQGRVPGVSGFCLHAASLVVSRRRETRLMLGPPCGSSGPSDE